MRALLLALAILATSAHAGERPRFDADATLRKAQVGTYSTRLAPARRVLVHRQLPIPENPTPADFERLECRDDPNRPYLLICEPRKNP